MKKNDKIIDVPSSILNTWQNIVDILANLNAIPASLIMRISGTDIEVLVSSDSEGNPYHLGDKEHLWGSGLYCETVIKTVDKLLVPNALADEDWNNNPDIKLNMISYLGFPILFPNKKPFGTLCILDNKENAYSETTEKLMQRLKELIEGNLSLLYMNEMLGDKNRELNDYLSEIQALRGIVPICANCKKIRDENDKWNPVEHYLHLHHDADFSHSVCPDCMKKLYPDF